MESMLVVLTLAVFRMTVPSGVPAGTRTTILTDRSPSAPTGVASGQSHLTNPPVADVGVTHAPPGLGEADTNATVVARTSTIDTSPAGSGPRFVATRT